MKEWGQKGGWPCWWQGLLVPGCISPSSFFVQLQRQEVVSCPWLAFTSSTLIFRLLSLRVFSGALGTCSARCPSWLTGARGLKPPGLWESVDESPRRCGVWSLSRPPVGLSPSCPRGDLLVGFSHFSVSLFLSLIVLYFGTSSPKKPPRSCLRVSLGEI